MKLRKSNYYEPKDRFWVRIALIVKGVSGAVGASAIFMDNKYVALGVLAAGMVANEMINFTRK